MRLLLQKVTEASVSVDSEVVGSISQGYLLFLGVMNGDGAAHAELLAEKVSKLRLFNSEAGKVNDQSILDVGGEILVVSQFTLAGKTEKGNRPDYTGAADADTAEKLYEYFIEKLQNCKIAKVAKGKFGAMMEVNLVNDGPVTLMIEQ